MFTKLTQVELHTLNKYAYERAYSSKALPLIFDVPDGYADHIHGSRYYLTKRIVEEIDRQYPEVGEVLLILRGNDRNKVASIPIFYKNYKIAIADSIVISFNNKAILDHISSWKKMKYLINDEDIVHISRFRRSNFVRNLPLYSDIDLGGDTVILDNVYLDHISEAKDLSTLLNPVIQLTALNLGVSKIFVMSRNLLDLKYVTRVVQENKCFSISGNYGGVYLHEIDVPIDLLDKPDNVSVIKYVPKEVELV